MECWQGEYLERTAFRWEKCFCHYGHTEADVNPCILFYATSSCCKQLDSNNHLHQDYSGRRAQPAQGNVCKW
ncbi:unnamed protein product [Urochloa humidicola]